MYRSLQSKGRKIRRWPHEKERRWTVEHNADQRLAHRRLEIGSLGRRRSIDPRGTGGALVQNPILSFSRGICYFCRSVSRLWTILVTVLFRATISKTQKRSIRCRSRCASRKHDFLFTSMRNYASLRCDPTTAKMKNRNWIYVYANLRFWQWYYFKRISSKVIPCFIRHTWTTTNTGKFNRGDGFNLLFKLWKLN